MSRKVHFRRAIADAKDAFLEVVRHYIQNVGHLLHNTILRHLLLDLSAENGNEDAPIRKYFGFIYTLHLLPAVFRNSFPKISYSGRKIPTLTRELAILRNKNEF